MIGMVNASFCCRAPRHVRLVCAVAAQEEEDVSPYREMKTLARAVELIRQDYVDEDKTEYEGLVYSALRGMLADLDPHSDFMTRRISRACRRIRGASSAA